MGMTNFWLQRTFLVEEEVAWKGATGNTVGPVFYFVGRFFAETRAEAEAILRERYRPLHGGVLRMREEEIVTTTPRG